MKYFLLNVIIHDTLKKRKPLSGLSKNKDRNLYMTFSAAQPSEAGFPASRSLIQGK